MKNCGKRVTSFFNICLNFEGDRQGDLTVHGGPDKAVYAYPIEHYEYWHKVFPTIEMPNGMFGENLTT